MRLGESLRKGMYLLGTLLVGKGMTSEDQVQAALGEQARRKQKGSPHKRLGQLLIEMSAVSNEDLDQVLEEQRRVRERERPREDDARTVGQAAEAAAAVPEAIEAEAATSTEPSPPAPGVDHSDAAKTPDEPKAGEATFVASAKGVVFHTPDCLAAKKIGANNRMTFSSREEAEAAGKRACSKCC